MSSRPDCGPPGPYTHLVASRDGLFLVDPDRYLKILDGLFFGVTLAGDRIYAFEGAHRDPENEDSRIVSFVLEDEAVVDHRVMADNLHGGCHQIDVFHDSLLVVDTHNQRLIAFDRRWRRNFHHPLPVVRHDGSSSYHHVNSLLGRGASLFLMLHNRGETQSERVEVDRDFRVVSRVELPGVSCHDLVLTKEEKWIMCDSAHGRLIDDMGQLAKVDELFTRGLAVGPDGLAVGSSLFGARPVRNLIPGFVTFMDRAFRRTGRLHIPAAPTQIRRLDGHDLSLSTPRNWP